MSFLLTLHHEDDLLATIDRVLTAADDDVTLVIPEGARILGSEENFVLLKREADAGGKRISIRTSDPRGRALAGKVGIPVVTQTPSSHGRRVLSDIRPPSSSPMPTKKATPPPVEEPEVFPEPEPLEVSVVEEPEPEIIEPVHEDSGQGALPLPNLEEEPLPFLKPATQKQRGGLLPRLRLPNFSLTGMAGGRLGIALIIVAGIGVAFLVANEVLPRAEIRITPKSEVITFSMPVTVAVGEVGAGDVPGQRITVSAREERSVPASGEEEVSERASGTIVIENAFSSESQTLVATTRFVSQGGHLFRLDETVVVPGASVEDGEIVPSTIQATISADEPGSQFNIGPATFSIPGFQGSPKYNKFTGRSSEPMRGGAEGKVKVVTAEDADAAREGIEEALLQRLQREFDNQTVESLVVPRDGQTIETNITLSAEAGDVADTVEGVAEGTLSAIAYNVDDLSSAVLESLRERIPADADVVEGSSTIAPTVVTTDLANGTLTLDVAIEARAAWRVDEGLVREAVAGRGETEIRSWLATYDAVEHARAFFWPFWVKTAPENPERTRVIVDLDAI